MSALQSSYSYWIGRRCQGGVGDWYNAQARLHTLTWCSETIEEGAKVMLETGTTTRLARMLTQCSEALWLRPPCQRQQQHIGTSGIVAGEPCLASTIIDLFWHIVL